MVPIDTTTEQCQICLFSVGLQATASTIYHWGDVELYLQWESKSDCITYILGLNCTFTNHFALFLDAIASLGMTYESM